MEKFQKRFFDEAHEYFDNLEALLLDLEDDFGNKQAIGEVFRIMHSLKGSGAMFGFDLLSEVTHDLESLYELVRNGSLSLDSKIVSFTLRSVDQLRQLLVLQPGEKEKGIASQLKSDISQYLDNDIEPQHDSIPVSEKIEEPVNAQNEKSFFVYFEPDENIAENGSNPLYLIEELCSYGECIAKVDWSKLPEWGDFDASKCYASWRIVLVTVEDVEVLKDVFLFVQDNSKVEIIELQDGSVMESTEGAERFFSMSLEELRLFKESAGKKSIQAKSTSNADVAEGEGKRLISGVQLSTIRVNASKIDEYMNLVSEMITAQSQLEMIAGKNKSLEPVSEHFNKLIRQLRDNAFDMSLVPLNNLATRFRRLVRDLSFELDKEVELVTEGLETEVDKNMIEKLAEPLLHILRNCIDHGIETVEERLAKGKTRNGVVLIKASYVGTFVEIEITDDGKGLDIAKIRSRALEKHFIDNETDLADPALIALIFEPGLSTSENLSDVSGRGVGMDIVRKRIQELRGDIEVDTKKGEGTNFTIRVPLTLSIIDGLLTRVNQEMYVIPTSAIVKIYALESSSYKKQIRQVLVFEGQEIPYLNLRKEFDPKAADLNRQYLIAVKHKDGLFGLVVDDVLREYQAVVKPLGEMLKHHDMFLGASILGDGNVSLVIDVKKTIQKFSA